MRVSRKILARMITSRPAAQAHAAIDAHCHLHDARFSPEKDGAPAHDQTVQAVVARARAMNVSHVVSCACFEADWHALDTLRQQQLQLPIVPAFGLHPWWSGDLDADACLLRRLRAKLEQQPNACLGEIGLCKSARGKAVPMDVQELAFEAQLQLATELKRPCVLHCVGAYGKLLEILQRTLKQTQGHLPPAIVLHSYSGAPAMVPSFCALEAKARASSTRVYFSLNTRQLLQNGGKAASTCARVPLSSLLVESDAPDQAPDAETMRAAWAESGLVLDWDPETTSLELNEPAFVQLALYTAAKVRNEPLADLAEAVYANSLRAFGIDTTDNLPAICM